MLLTRTETSSCCCCFCVFHPDCRSHVVRADFSKVSAHDAIVKAVKQHDDANVHRVLSLDPAHRNKDLRSINPI